MKAPIPGPVPRRPSLAETVKTHDAKLRAAKLADGPPLPDTQPYPPADTMPRAVHTYLQETIGAPPPPATALVTAPDPSGRLPSAWYKDPAVEAAAEQSERHANLIRGGALACIVTGAALGFWLVMRSGPSTQPPAPPRVMALMAATETTPTPVLLRPQSAAVPDGITADQILGEARKFLAQGDILAARALLISTATAGDPQAQFVLAETYDPNFLRWWNVKGIESNAGSARQWYYAARRGGMAEAQGRLDALP